MLQRILVPLDGSELAEAALPYVREISQRCEPAEVILLRVVRPPSGQAATVFMPVDTDFPGETTPGSAADVERSRHPIYREQAIASAQAKAKSSLTPIARQLQEEGIEARAAVSYGRPAQEIVRFAEQAGVDLIVMCTHGRSGVSRWILGSVADKVMRGTHLPVMLVRPPSITSVPRPARAEAEG